MLGKQKNEIQIRSKGFLAGEFGFGVMGKWAIEAIEVLTRPNNCNKIKP